MSQEEMKEVVEDNHKMEERFRREADNAHTDGAKLTALGMLRMFRKNNRKLKRLIYS